jgi:hypothetical protein
MTWFKVDDKLSAHPKAKAAGNRAMGLWVMAGSWSSAYLTDGFVPVEFVKDHRYGLRDAETLVEVGLWHPVDGGWLFHEWDQSNPTRAQVEAKREADRLRKGGAKGEAVQTDSEWNPHGLTRPPTRPGPTDLAAKPVRDDAVNAQGMAAARVALTHRGKAQ